MDLHAIVHEECCTILTQRTKTEAILEIIETIVKSGQVQDIENLKKEIFYREQLMSTGIGLGVGIPHVRYDGVQTPMVAVGVQPEGITDYKSIDDQIIRFIVIILVGKNQHREHIRILAIIVNLLKDEVVRYKLSSAKNGEEVYNIITGDDRARLS